jgi:hypothetical protein
MLRYVVAIAALTALPASAIEMNAALTGLKFELFDLNPSDGIPASLTFVRGQTDADVDFRYFDEEFLWGPAHQAIGPATIDHHGVQASARVSEGSPWDASLRGPTGTARTWHDPARPVSDYVANTYAHAGILHAQYEISTGAALRLSGKYFFDAVVSRPGDRVKGEAVIVVEAVFGPTSRPGRAATAGFTLDFEDGYSNVDLPEDFSVWWVNIWDTPQLIDVDAWVTSYQTHFYQPVPEPPAAWLLAVGAAALAGGRRLAARRRGP